MKIGVLTLPLHTNYGGNLQAYALMATLKDMGHDAWLIRCTTQGPPSWRRPLIVAKRLLRRHLGGQRQLDVLEGIWDGRKRRLAATHARRFIERHIAPCTRAVGSGPALRRLVLSQGFDAVVVGSDQVWRPQYAPNVEDYFLGFLKPADGRIRRVAYAASFGTDTWALNENQRRTCAALLQGFDAVSVREDSGVRLCERQLGVAAEHVIDPTLLLPTSRYLALLEDQPPTPPSSDGAGLFVYVLDAGAGKHQVVADLAAGLALQPFTVDGEPQAPPAPSPVVPPVEDWIRSFHAARYVFTDSFHGCVFAILFNKPFLVFGNPERGLARFESLLATFGLQDRLVTSAQALTPDRVHRAIDWPRVNRLLDEQRGLAAAFLRRALGEA